jgi:hypothetical protein
MLPTRVLPCSIAVNTCQYDEDGDVVMQHIDDNVPTINWLKPIVKKTRQQ